MLYHYTITEKSTAHMVAQIRAKQLATKSTQDKLIKAINYKLEEVQDTPGDKLIESIGNELEGWKTLVAECNTSFKKELLVEKLGFPIMYNKTFLQLDMLSKFLEHKGYIAVTDIQKGILYNDLKNDVSAEVLPVLSSPNYSHFWGGVMKTLQ